MKPVRKLTAGKRSWAQARTRKPNGDSRVRAPPRIFAVSMADFRSPGYNPSMNLAELFLRYSRKQPRRIAMILADQKITYGELEQRVRAIQTGLRREGFRPGDRAVVVVPVSVDLYALLLALFSLGVVPVLLDSSMGLK